VGKPVFAWIVDVAEHRDVGSRPEPRALTRIVVWGLSVFVACLTTLNSARGQVGRFLSERTPCTMNGRR
jgi:hypothetical protein